MAVGVGHGHWERKKNFFWERKKKFFFGDGYFGGTLRGAGAHVIVGDSGCDVETEIEAVQ